MPETYSSSYQIPTRIRLYVSYPLWQYANGGLNHIYPDDVYDEGGVYPGNLGGRDTNKEDMIELIKFYDNQTQTTLYPPSFPPGALENEVKIGWQVVDRPTYWTNEEGTHSHTGRISGNPSSADHGLWDFNYAMILNHNFGETTNGTTFKFYQIRGTHNNNTYGDGWSEEYDLDGGTFDRNIVNAPDDVTVPLNGFSVINLKDYDSEYMLGMGLKIYTEDGYSFQNFPRLSSVLWGKYFDFKDAVNGDVQLGYKYDNKKIKNMYGDTISAAQWNRADGWYGKGYTGGFDSIAGGVEPFGLRPGDPTNVINIASGNDSAFWDHANTFRRKSGLRVWKMNFDFVSSGSNGRLMPQNPMLNSNGWVGYDTNGELFDSFYQSFGQSKYDIHNAGFDFYTNVVHRTNGGELPMVLCLDRFNPSPQNFAIVRMSKYKIVRTGFKTYKIKLTLEEQV